MAIRVVEFSNGRYKIRKIFAKESTNPKEIIEKVPKFDFQNLGAHFSSLEFFDKINF